MSPPTASSGYLPQETERLPGETVRGFLGRRTGVTAAQAALDAATDALAEGGPGADDAYADGARALARRSVAPTSRSAPRTVADDLGLAVDCSTRR